MLPSEMKDYCNSLQAFEVTANVRLKSESKIIEGKVTGIESNHFLLQTNTQQEPISLLYIAVANISSSR